MDHNQDFAALRSLLAMKKLDMPQDTQVDEFLTELHRRQRVQLLARESIFSRATGWIKERIAGFELVPSLSYGAAAAAIAITAFAGLSQQVQVTKVDGQSYQLSLRMPSHDSAFAMLPATFTPGTVAGPKAENPTFAPSHTEAATTRFVLANNSRTAYDATVAF